MGGAVVVMSKSTFSFGLVFLYCEMGQQIAVHFDKVDETILEMDWYLFPIKTQRMLPTILMVTQEPVQLQGFGNVPATRATFKGVIQLKFRSSIIIF